MRLICVVDDAVQRSSPFWGEHGLALLIEKEGRRVLYDTGQSGTVLLHNLKLLGVEPATIDTVAISHAHYDHTGGLPALLKHLRPGTPLYAKSDLFRERFSRRQGETQDVGLTVARAELAEQMTLMLSATPQEIVPGVWTTVERAFERPIAVIAGGLHLTSATDDELQHVGEVLAAMPALQHVYPNHCTGEAAFVALTQVLGPSVMQPCPVGTVLEF